MVNKIDLDFISRNWLGLSRLGRLGYNRKEAMRIIRDIEAGKLTFKNVKKK